jgi:two-component system, cell cycle response regulator
MPNARILVADGDGAVLQTVTWLLREHGYDVRTAASGADVPAVLLEYTPDLVLLDVTLPGIDGYQLLERIKSDPRWRELPVLIMSGLPPEEAAVRALGLGAADFVKKPFRVKELLARIQAQLRMRTILRSASEALSQANRELERVRGEAEHRRQLVDILHEVSEDLSTGEIYHLLARRVARALELTHCSVILAKAGERPRVVATAFEQGSETILELELERYPEIQMALESGRAVLVEDVATSPIYEGARARWAAAGMKVTVRSVIALPFALQPTQAGVFFLRRSVHEPPLTRDDLEFADTVVRAAVTAIQRAQALESTKADNRRLEQLARTDPLTRVLNRRALTERLVAETERVKRYESEVSLLLIDLDHFKKVNDNYGHLVGDDVLAEMAAYLQGAVRAVDVVARYGGEEFVVVLPETGAPGAQAFAERLREGVEARAFTRGSGGTLQLTASIGVATFPSPGIDSPEDLLAAADQALYRAKAEGRNRVRA